MSYTIKLFPLIGDFGSNKNLATNLRKQEILPRITQKKEVILDFTNVTGATQSFIHVLIAEPLQLHGIEILKYLKFQSASPIIQNLIKLVVDYTLLSANTKTP